MSITILCAGALARPRGSSRIPVGPDAPNRPALLDDQGAFARLLRRARVTARSSELGPVPDEAPHEAWLRTRFGLEGSVAACALPADEAGAIGLLARPVHLRLALDHALLAAPASMALDADEAQALAGQANTVLADEGLRLVVARPDAWRLEAAAPGAATADLAALAALRTRSARLAWGRDVDAFQPSGAAARRWRQLDTLVQMAWFEHPVNTAREATGRPIANALWLEGVAGRTARQPFARVAATEACIVGLARRAGAEVGPAGEVEAAAAWLRATSATPGDVLLAPDAWHAAAQRPEPDTWTRAWLEFDRWFDGLLRAAPALDAQAWHIVLTGDRGTVELTRTPVDRWKAWRRLQLASLLEGPA